MPIRRPVLIALAAAAALAALTGCTVTVPGTGAVGVRLDSKGPAGAVPAGLEWFYAQPLGWGSCASFSTTAEDKAAFSKEGLECARLTVPLDYANPRGRTISLGMLRQAGSDRARRSGSLLVNPGGPGASGMSAAASLAGQIKDSDLGRRLDLVGFDPRGVGASEPQVHCLTDVERDADRLEVPTDTSPEGIAKVEADHKAYADKCAQRTGADVLANLGSREVARDMDVMRSALGDDKLTYLGYSYGTRIGSTYAETFPANVRALVLDGALDPDQDPATEVVAQASGFQKAFEDFTTWCATRQDCALGRDPGRAVQAFRDLVLPLISHPVEVGAGRRLSYSDATTGAVQALYSRDLWPPLNTGLTELRNNRGSALMLLADTYFGRGPDGRYSTITDAFTAIRCVDDPRVTDRAAALETERRYDQAAPFLDSGIPPTGALDACAYWPVPNTGQPHKPQVQGLPPVLVVSTTNDPATPYQAGVDLATALHGGLLTFEGTQHTAFLHGNKCVDGAGIGYLVNLTLPPAGTRCS